MVEKLGLRACARFKGGALRGTRSGGGCRRKIVAAFLPPTPPFSLPSLPATVPTSSRLRSRSRADKGLRWFLRPPPRPNPGR